MNLLFSGLVDGDEDSPFLTPVPGPVHALIHRRPRIVDQVKKPTRPFNVEEGGSNIYLYAVHGKYNSTDFEFNGETLTVPDEDYTRHVSNSVGVLGLTTDPSTGFTFTKDGVLQLNGDSDGFYACHNSTEDPRHRSANFGTLQLFYDHTPTDTACTKVELIKELQTSISAPPVSA
ncbi:unnamed protein product [Ambrosiozyma monospora]|uniref:Unnamed protein product n=1 Tax=Ambrosiozyma monospora TaxID=43982 RepID=A0ACB5SYJ6_AMBMO|nr:unnamed protein product [Ambrosiozyma monospora]